MDAEKLRKIAETLRTQSQELEQVKQENASLKKTAEASDLARSMVEKGLISPEKAKEKTAEWLESDVDLSRVEESIKMAEDLNQTPLWDGVENSSSAQGADPESKIVSWVMGSR